MQKFTLASRTASTKKRLSRLEKFKFMSYGSLSASNEFFSFLSWGCKKTFVSYFSLQKFQKMAVNARKNLATLPFFSSPIFFSDRKQAETGRRRKKFVIDRGWAFFIRDLERPEMQACQNGKLFFLQPKKGSREVSTSGFRRPFFVLSECDLGRNSCWFPGQLYTKKCEFGRRPHWCPEGIFWKTDDFVEEKTPRHFSIRCQTYFPSLKEGSVAVERKKKTFVHKGFAQEKVDKKNSFYWAKQSEKKRSRSSFFCLLYFWPSFSGNVCIIGLALKRPMTDHHRDRPIDQGYIFFQTTCSTCCTQQEMLLTSTRAWVLEYFTKLKNRLRFEEE